MKGDWEGKPTYVGGEGSSVLDLVVEIENESGSIIDELNVETRIESDHLPVEISIGKRGYNGGSRNKKAKGTKEYRLWWDNDLREEYRNKMERRAEGMEEEGLGIQDRWERLLKNIWEVGWDLKLVKEQKRGKGGKR